MTDLGEIYEDTLPAEEECKMCGYALAGIGILIGVVFLYMSVDVLTGGSLTSKLGLGTARGDSE